ncbi:hypothetical protein G6F62_002823 [Rhizopus arrhizus]|uniref:Uncharacterized protein n=1 Tax=Rhizopus oryzae TaxID=64495 RepID=A0A9P6X680_RHIOR|nr:hypothetical protein G6F23_007592 [Rhizopus arrhizus]KAG0768761.1 hypothetical protein G6F24_001664 [Rhizopus arrhizus]KAG0790927.1 hypothetical protein G6F22_006278 [Rhizopus arrhizus]KAG0792730.1 hypothetical protein G6F21_004146 [Rhizopus arrhizus]KAG0816106.1 hypothetical protein G6F20_003461 [Rhizopus arrhizus]
MTKAFEILVRDTQTKLRQLFLKKADKNPNSTVMIQSAKIPWSWIAVQVARILIEYPTGLTHVILLAILELEWEKTFLKKFKGFDSDFGTIQAVYDCVTAETFLLEVKVIYCEPIPSGTTFKITVTDEIREMDILMHPKFTPWIENMGFIHNRKIRIVCPPKVNTPIQDRSPHIPRRLYTALIPPTELLLLMLTRKDKAFVQSRFTKLRDAESTSWHVWLKIIHVEHTKQNKHRIDVYLADMSSDALPVILSLYDDQTHLASIFRRNDYMALSNPAHTHTGPQPMNPSGIVLEYTNDTVIFLMPEAEAQAAGLAKMNLSSYMSSQDSSSLASLRKEIIERDEEGFMDCSNYEPRIFVSDLVHCMLNVTLLGKVVGLAKNNPFYKNGKRMDRYALKIADMTGTMDITLWEEAGHGSRTLRIGQYILLEQLVTSDKHQSGQKKVWYVNGSTVCGTKLYNISTITALLTSSSFRIPAPLWHAKESGSDHFQIEAMVIGWELHTFINNQETVYTNESQDILIQPSQHIVSLSHTTCLLPLSATEKECEFCGYPTENEVVHIFRPKSANGREDEGWIEWVLDDGTSICRAFGGEESLLNTTAQRYSQLLPSNQINMLNDVIGLSIFCSLTDTERSCYRLEQIAVVEPTLNECSDLLENTLIAAGLLAAASQALAAITVVNPWGSSTWTAGGHGEISWNATSPDDTLNCDIQLLNGDNTHANLVAQITNPDTPIACSAGKYDMYPLNDFAAGQYWIRIGQNSTGNWYYSGLFTFSGNGTSKPISLASSATVAPVAAATANPATSSNAAIGVAAASVNDAGSLTANAVLTLGAVAAAAALAL